MVAQIPSSLLSEWEQFLGVELNDHTKEDYYHAQIAQGVHGMFSKRATKLDEYLIRFRGDKKRDTTQESKNYWELQTGKRAK
jgi:hypothetical protein